MRRLHRGGRHNGVARAEGYQFNLGGSSDSYKVTAENRNDFENTVEKSYTYEKSTTTSTTVSNTYSQNWTEETTVGVEFSVPVLTALSPTAKVEQSFPTPTAWKDLREQQGGVLRAVHYGYHLRTAAGTYGH